MRKNFFPPLSHLEQVLDILSDAVALHDYHMKDPESVTEESQEELGELIKKAGRLVDKFLITAYTKGKLR